MVLLSLLLCAEIYQDQINDLWSVSLGFVSSAHQLQNSLWLCDAGVEERVKRHGKGHSKEAPAKISFPVWLSFENFSSLLWNLRISHTGHIVYTSRKSEQHFCSWPQLAEIVLSLRGPQPGTMPSHISSRICASARDKRRLWRGLGGLRGMLRMGFEN